MAEMATTLDGFKETEIGPIPVDWDVVNIANVIDNTMSGDWGKENNDEYPDWVQCQIIRGTDFPTVATGRFANVPKRYVRPSSIEKRQLRPDDMLVEISGGSKYQLTGRILRITPQLLANVRLPVLFTNFVKLFRADRNSVAPSFFHLFWEYLYSLGRTCIYEKRTTGIRNFKYKDFLASEIIPLPPLPEQHRIAHVLSTIQRAIAAQDDLIAATREVKRSLMQCLFTYGPGVEPAPTKETEVGEIPEHWEVVRLGDLALLVNSGLTPRGGKKVYQSDGIPFIRSQNVLMNRLSLDGIAYVSEEIHRQMKRSQVQPDDVLLNITGASIGRVTHVPDSIPVANVNQHVCRIRLDVRKSYPPYIACYLATDRAQVEIMGTQFGTTRQGLNYGQVRMLRVRLPSLEEQYEIAAVLKVADDKITAEEQRKAALQALFKSMLHQLMTGQVRLRDVEFEG